ncbi:MAG TPA: porin family protein [Chitinophagaceae bacterium]|nr:porin family protein [Chitinophagaceae bacterium]
MKKLLLFVAVCFITERSSAQLSIAPELGVQMSNVRTGSGDSLFSGADTKYKTGFRAGANLAIGLTKNLNIHVGAFYSTKGTKSEVFGIKAIANTNHIDIPVYVNYNILTKDGNQFFVGVGPYASYCMSGKTKIKGSFLGVSIDESEDLNIGSDATDDIKSLDFGANANIGFVSSMGLYARASYSLGFANISNSSAPNSEVKTTGFALSVGYQFSLNKKNKVAATAE